MRFRVPCAATCDEDQEALRNQPRSLSPPAPLLPTLRGSAQLGTRAGSEPAVGETFDGSSASSPTRVRPAPSRARLRDSPTHQEVPVPVREDPQGRPEARSPYDGSARRE